MQVLVKVVRFLERPGVEDVGEGEGWTFEDC